MTPQEVLAQARALILDEKNWTKGYWAKSKGGRHIDYMSPKACKYCTGGAILFVVNGDPVMFNKITELLRPHMDHVTLTVFNDTHTHEEVIELLDKAI